ncbi:MAG: FAD-dependent oxidoreductase, partial [Pseudomonadota bacterium]
MKDRKTGEFQSSVFGVTLAGCPLEEKISEMHTLKTDGCAVGALAVAVVDNPMIAGTGHRICNDCMKACIYQKQNPVDIPQAETRTLKDVLSLPWGFEIYSLLTRWNPLNLRQPVAKPDSGKRVLVAGLGPAGYTLAHYLLNQGHTVVGVDGLKIEPLDPRISGVDAHGVRHPFRPIRAMDEIYEGLDERQMAGFGGVAEYGITVRWDKNFLKIIRLLLERRSSFAMHGGVRLGGTMTIDQAFEAGFDHVALAMGAGRPTIIDMPNGLAPGVRQASDFLMALQLTGAAKSDSIANLQLRLPVVVIGGGLTAIDTATESRAYYVVQVEKFLARYETLSAEMGEAAVRARFSDQDHEVADEFLAHGRAIRGERAAAAKDDRNPNFDALIDSWGGVTVAYRKRMIDSPSYTLNHEEVELALQEGIRFAEQITPTSVDVDTYGHVAALKGVFKTSEGDQTDVTLPARSILVAAGTKPNTVIAREGDSHVSIDGKYFQAFDENGNAVKPELISKPLTPQVLADVQTDGRAVSFFGDLHPSFAGNVVKAMGGSKQGWPIVDRMLAKRPAATESQAQFQDRIRTEMRAKIVAVNRLTPTIVEVVVEAPAAARAFHPGQFYRLQNFE